MAFSRVISMREAGIVAAPLSVSEHGEEDGSYDTAGICTAPLGGGALGDGDVGSGSGSEDGCPIDGSEAVWGAPWARLPPNKRSFHLRKDGIFEDTLWIPTGVEKREKRKNIAETRARALAGRFRGTYDYLSAYPACVMHNTYMQDGA
jgi:hypothetical protein